MRTHELPLHAFKAHSGLHACSQVPRYQQCLRTYAEARGVMQLHDNFGALAVIPKLTPEIMQQIDDIFKVGCYVLLPGSRGLAGCTACLQD